MSFSLRIDALEAEFRRRDDEDGGIRSMVEEIRDEIRELGKRVGTVEADLDALKRGKGSGRVGGGGGEQDADRIDMEAMSTGALCNISFSLLTCRGS